MKADVSRVTFDPRRHYTSVRKQQGRVDLDADWNEQQDIDGHLRVTSLADVIGGAGAPIDDAAFALVPVAAAGLQLSGGRYYLDGLVCESEDKVSLFAQPDLPPDGPFVFTTDGKPLASGAAAPSGVYVAWLHVWPQHVSVVEQPALREIALNGPDTTTRARTAWQVRLVQAGPPGTVVGCADLPPSWAALTGPSTGTLAAFADPTGGPAPDCVIPLASPYRGLDNHLYRVEIHDGGTGGNATFVWSKDNGSVVASWEATDVDTLTVKSPGRDGSDGFTSGCFVELTDDRHEQLGRPGTLVQVDRAEGDSLVLKAGTATGSINHDDFEGRPRARRWDGTGTVPTDGSAVPLELGITVRFSAAPGATYHAFDYWSFPARSATHDVEWPADPATGNPADLLPQGPQHHHARLAVLAWDGTTWAVTRDCRPLFAPLVDQVAMAYVGGDTQQALPNIASPTTLVPLDRPLAVGVASGKRPVANARVQFTVTSGVGLLEGTSTTLVKATDANGLASAAWNVDSTNVVQSVQVTLLAEDGHPTGLPLQFSAHLARADGVAYDPKASPSLSGAVTVQQAIDRLAATTGGGCDTLNLTPQSDWMGALEALKAGTTATVCFQPGVYTATRQVHVRGVTNLRLHGAGPGTQLQANGPEAILVVESTQGLSVRDLSVEVTAYGADAGDGQMGVITAIDCTRVEVDNVRLACPADAFHRGSCLTVRTSSISSADTVLVRDCDLVVGHGQTGVLVVNTERAQVTGSTFRTPAKPGSLNLAALLANPDRLTRLASRLAGNLVVDRTQRITQGDFNTSLQVGNFAVRMNSAVPATEWRTLVAANPPTANDTANVPAMNAYMSRIVDQAAANPQQLPAFNRQLGGLSRKLGDRSTTFLDSTEGRASLRTILGGDQIDVQPASFVAAIQREVNLPTTGGTVRFDSKLLTQDQWEAALGAVPAKDSSPSGIAKHVKGLARQILIDPNLAGRVAPGLIGSLNTANPSAAACGLKVGGALVGDIVFEGNTVSSAAEGVHVASSFRRSPGSATRAVRSIRVRGNEFNLVVPVELPAAARGIFVGNATRVVVADNKVRVPGSSARAGIHIEGALGSHVVVRDNDLENCQTGVLMVEHGSPATPLLWNVVDNFAPGAKPVVNVPLQARATGNVG